MNDPILFLFWFECVVVCVCVCVYFQRRKESTLALTSGARSRIPPSPYCVHLYLAQAVTQAVVMMLLITLQDPSKTIASVSDCMSAVLNHVCLWAVLNHEVCLACEYNTALIPNP